MAEVWEFISNPANLKVITPEYMGFHITTKHLSAKMYPGQIISYTVSPALGIPLTWVTEISQVKEMEYFVDTQLVGPYKLWHHQHTIKKIDGGVLMTDLVTYAPPLGILGRIANSLMINKKIQQIFDYREKKLVEIFGEMPSSSRKRIDEIRIN